MNEAQKELILKPSPEKWFLIALFVAVACIGGGISMVSQGLFLGWLFVVLGGFLTPFCLWVPFAPRMRLHLTEAGFSFGTLRRRSTYRWTDISKFFAFEFGALRRVTFCFSPSFIGEGKVRRINQRFGRFDRFLPDTYGMERRALAELLEKWRIAHSSDHNA